MAKVSEHEWTDMRIRELRIRMGKTQTEFAAMLKTLAAPMGLTCEKQRVSKWERGEGRPGLRWLPIFRALDATAPQMSTRKVVGVGLYD